MVLPLLAPGYVLAYDMVFVPDAEPSLELLGVSRTLPRAVPNAFLVALASRAVGGQVVQKLALLGIFAGGVFGAARLVPAHRTASRLAGGLLYMWAPFVHERLLLGQWAFLLGYAVLPWTVRASLRLREGERAAGWGLGLALAAATAASPYAGVLGVAVAAGVALWPPAGARPGRRGAVLAAAAVAASLPWLVPALLHPGTSAATATGLDVFGARSDSPLGTMGSLLTLGGLWRPDLSPAGRDGLAWLPAFLVIAGVAVVGFLALRVRWPRGARNGLAAVAAVGLVLAAGPRLPVVRDAMAFVAERTSGGGILRDSQKFAVPWALLLAVAFGAGVDRALHRVAAAGRARGSRSLLPIAVAVLALLPVSLAPTLAWGAAGRLDPVAYPASWERAHATMATDPVPGAVLVLPWHTYLPFRWNHERTVYDPAVQYFDRVAVADTALEVGPLRLPPEDPWSGVVEPWAFGRPEWPELEALGVRYVLLLREADWQRFAPRTAGLRPVLDTGDLALYRAPPPGPPPSFGRPPAGPVVAADLLAGLLLVVAVARLAVARTSSRSTRGTAILRGRRRPDSGESARW